MITTTTVFIWYPIGRNVGHASLYLGDHQCATNQLMSHRPSARGRYIKNLRQKAADEFKHPDNITFPSDENYVSWWPDWCKSKLKLMVKSRTGYNKGTLYDDVASEGREPDTIFFISGLNINSMRTAWKAFKEARHGMYNFKNRNCSTAVWHILVAGGIENSIKSKFITPKDIASSLTKMKNQGLGVIKEKSETCPTKLNVLYASILGFR